MKIELPKAQTDSARIRILLDLVNKCYTLNRQTESTDYLNKVEKLLKSTDYSDGMVRFCSSKFRYEFTIANQWDSALFFAHKGLATLEKYPEKSHPSWYPTFWVGIGLIHKNLQEHDSAFKYYNKVVEWPNKDIYSMYRINNALVNLKNLHIKLGNKRAALKYANKCLESAKNIDDPTTILGAYDGLAKAYYSAGMYEKSMNLIDQVMNEYRLDSLAYASKIHSLYGDRGNCLVMMQDYANAIENFKVELRYIKNVFGELHPQSYRPLNSLAGAYRRANVLDSASNYFKKILSIRFDPNDKRKLSAIVNLGRIAVAKKDYKTAEKYFKKAKEFESKDPSALSSIQSALAQMYTQTGAIDKAIHHGKLSIIQNREDSVRMGFNKLAKAWSNISQLDKLASLYEIKYERDSQTESLSDAMNYYSLADSLLTDLRSTITSQDDEIDFNTLFESTYTGGIRVAHRLYQKTREPYYIEQAFFFAEKSKSSVLFNSLLRREKMSFSGIPDSLIALEQSLKSSILFYKNKLINKAILTSEKIQKYESKLLNHQTKLEELILNFREKYPEYYNTFHHDEFLSITGVQGKLGKNETALEFSIDGDSLFTFIVSSKDFKVLKTGIPSELDSIVSLHKNSLSSLKETFNHSIYGGKLYEILIAPLKGHLNTEELVIIPDGILWHVNFELLQSNFGEGSQAKYMLYDHAISYANSLNQLFLHNDKDDYYVKEGVLAFSYSNGDLTRGQAIDLERLRDADSELPGTSKEIREIANLMPGSYYYGEAADEKNFKEQSADYAILHLALHGEIDNEDPNKSRLRFFESKTDTLEDNYLHVYELYEMDLDAKLAVLSACNTGIGQLEKGEGIMSLGRAFQYAGAESLLISNWPLVDEMAPGLVKEFYKNLKEGMSKSEALRQAKITYLEFSNSSFSHPYFWGAFVVIGDNSPMFKGRSYSGIFVLVLVTFSLFVFLFLIYKLKKTRKLN
ncbi:MAG: CHAT domain-containing protein [Ekhidna sp.]